MDMILGITMSVLTFLAWWILLPRLNPGSSPGIINRLKEHQMGSKLMVAFLVGLIFFVLFTGKVPKPVQKIPIIIFALLLIGANLFLQIPVGKRDEPGQDQGEKEIK